MSPYQLDYFHYKLIRKGEIPTAVPFKVATHLGLRGINGLILLANEDLHFHSEDRLIFGTRQITLACMNDDLEFPTDGLHHIINFLNKHRIKSKDFLVTLYIYNSQDSKPSISVFQELIDSNNSILGCNTFASRVQIAESELLAFMNISKSYFRGLPQRLFLSDQYPKNAEKNFSTKLNNFLVNSHNNYYSVDYRKLLNSLQSSPNSKPIIVKPDKTNDILLRSVLVSNWLMNAKNANERVLAANLINKYGLHLKNWQEHVATSVWSGKWDDVSWMGRMAISWAKERREDNGAKQAISLLRRRTILFLIYPAFLGFLVREWLIVLNNVTWNGLFPLVAFIAIFLVPRWSVGVFYSMAKFKMEHPVKMMSTFGFVLGGLASVNNISYLSSFTASTVLSLSLTLWLIWLMFPVTSKFGKLLFDLIVLIVPIMALSLGHNLWEHYIASTQIYMSNLISNLYEVFGSLVEIVKEIILSSSQ